MILNYLTQTGKKKFFKTVIYILIMAFTFTTCSCYSSYEGKVRPESIRDQTDYHILKAVMKDGTVIDLRHTECQYAKKYQDKSDVIVYATADTTWIGAEVYNVSNVKTGFLQLKDIQTLVIQKEEINTGMVVLGIVGVVAVIAAIIIIVSSNSDDHSYHPPSYSGGEKYSCPFIYSFDGEKYIFDGEPYGGAITEGLKKTDYSRLDNLKLIDGKYKILLRNETDETQHTDEMKLLAVDHPVNTEAAIDYAGNVTIFKKAVSPFSARDENGNDISVFFKNRDEIKWQTNMPDDKNYDQSKLRHELILKFPKPKDAKKAKLLVNAGTSIWGELMVKNMLDMKGSNVDKWYKEINNNGQEKAEFHKFMEREEMYLMKVNVLENDMWVPRGLITNSGPYKDEDRIIELNTENVTGDTLCIKFNPPYGFWKIDYAGMIYESEAPSNIKALPINQATDENGVDVKETMSAIDGGYYSMPELTNFSKIEFNAPVQNKNMKQTLFLKTTGYYEIHLKKDKPEQTELLNKIFSTPGAILEISMKEYFKKMQSLGFLEK